VAYNSELAVGVTSHLGQQNDNYSGTLRHKQHPSVGKNDKFCLLLAPVTRTSYTGLVS